jgi:hypothetical protein
VTNKIPERRMIRKFTHNTVFSNTFKAMFFTGELNTVGFRMHLINAMGCTVSLRYVIIIHALNIENKL